MFENPNFGKPKKGGHKKRQIVVVKGGGFLFLTNGKLGPFSPKFLFFLEELN
tara:strand:+ start:7 stop:162 length:156 start_codon:yes stop_codon:yes gene_type:complete